MSEYTHLEESCDCLKILSFDEIEFLNKAKIMYKIANSIAPIYLINLFQMGIHRMILFPTCDQWQIEIS